MQADGCTMKENTEPCPAENGGQRVVGGERACINQFPWLVYVECTRWAKQIITPSNFVIYLFFLQDLVLHRLPHL